MLQYKYLNKNKTIGTYISTRVSVIVFIVPFSNCSALSLLPNGMGEERPEVITH
jgi:hypothetical protein